MKKIDNQDIQYLRGLIKKVGISQQELAGFLGVHYNTVNNWLKGRSRIPESVLILVGQDDLLIEWANRKQELTND